MELNSTPTPRRIALLAALIISVIPALSLVIITKNLLFSILIFALGTVVGYLVINYFLERFIYRKIKIMYKNIHRLNTEHLHDRDNGKDSIENVSEEVLNWAKESREEIASLKKQELFKREFIGNISHELKTPIFQIQGYVHTLLEGALSDPKVNYRFLKKTSKSADRLVELVNDLTSLNLIESGELRMTMAKFDVHTLLEEVYEEFEFLAKKTKQHLGFKRGSDKSLKVKADRKRIKQVLVNLISNAIIYGRTKGNIKCGVYDMDTYVLIEVTDDGEGIPPESQSRLFERFYRVEKSRNRDAGGSGLGLSIAKHIVEAHNQSIHVRSKEGHGATFSFTLKKAK